MSRYVFNRGRVCARSFTLQLTSFDELGVQIRQAAGDRVSEPAAADPVVGLHAQVATQRALRRTMQQYKHQKAFKRVSDMRKGERTAQLACDVFLP